MVYHGTVKANNNLLGNCCQWFMAHCHKLLKLSPHYVIIESTLWFDDVGVLPGLLPLFWVVKGQCMQSRKWSGRQPGNEASQRLH